MAIVVVIVAMLFYHLAPGFCSASSAASSLAAASRRAVPVNGSEAQHACGTLLAPLSKPIPSRVFAPLLGGLRKRALLHAAGCNRVLPN